MILLFLLVGFAQGAELNFNFAYQNSAGGSIYIQAGATAGQAVETACGGDKHLCLCELKSDAGKVIREKARFYPSGAYFICEAEGKKSASQARIVKRGAPLSPWLKVLDSVGLRQILGAELDGNRVRSVYKYHCLHTFLQKEGTSKFSFDCSSRTSLCGNPGSKNGDFCLLQAQSSYYLYADNLSTNFSEKEADSLYGSGNTICGLYLFQFQCTGAGGMPNQEFGLYGQPIGVWNLPVELEVSPRAAPAIQGYAQKVSASGDCPPWLEKRSMAQASVSLYNQIDSNFPDVFSSKQTVKSGSAPGDLAVWRVSGGDCDGTTCSKPNLADGTVASASYSEEPASHFCAIPAELTFD